MGTDEVGRAVQGWLAGGWAAAFARVVEMRGGHSAGEGELFACNELGETVGDLLGGEVTGPVRAAAAAVLAAWPLGGIETLDLAVGDAGGTDAVLGGGVSVVVQSTGRVPWQLWSALADQRPVAICTALDAVASGGSLVVVDHGGSFGSITSTEVDRAVECVARDLLESGNSGVRIVDQEGMRVLVEAFVPEPRLIVVGGGILADAIVFQAAALGWPAAVAADEAEATAALDWAGAAAALVMLSHDPDLDVRVLGTAAARGIGYLGALGSRRRQQDRAERLRSLGVAEADIARIHGPIGLDLGGDRPQYIALAVCAEILAYRNRRDGTARPERSEIIGSGAAMPSSSRAEAAEPKPPSRPELLNGPLGSIRVPADIHPLLAAGFVLRVGEDRVVLDVLSDEDDLRPQTVIARLAFTADGFERFVAGLIATQRG